jgi:hypothetical protein
MRYPRTAAESQFPRLYPDLGWWCPSLQPMGGDRLHDFSRSQNFATLTSMDPATDWVVSDGQGALDFDGSNDYALTTGLACNGSVGDFTVSAWLKTTSTTRGTICGVVETGIAGIIHLAVNTINTTTDTSGAIYFQVRQAGHNQAYATSTGVNDGRWHNIVAVRSMGAVSVYLDGRSLSLTFTSIQTSTEFIVLTRKLGIGSRNLRGVFDVPLAGQLDDLRLFSRASLIDDAATLYRLGRGNLPLARRRRYTEQAAPAFRSAWAARNPVMIGGGLR